MIVCQAPVMRASDILVRGIDWPLEAFKNRFSHHVNHSRTCTMNTKHLIPPPERNRVPLPMVTVVSKPDSARGRQVGEDECRSKAAVAAANTDTKT